jgi:protein SMG6
LDAVYLYMRSLMASNPFHSAKESLVSLFDENRKKYEQQERKRREAKDAKGKESASSSSASEPAERIGDKRSVRREIWIHPLDGRRTHRTTASSKESPAHQNSDDEELSQLPSIEVRFIC